MASANTSAGVICEGDKAILKRGKTMQCVQIERRKKYNIEKLKFQLNGAIGFPYGTVFEVTDRDVCPVQPEEEVSEQKDVERDNRNLMDTSDNQKLGLDDIEQMKKEGVSGENIISQLVENSATFAKKTEYAQHKYLSKKKRKHLPQFSVLLPSTRLISEMYYFKAPTKICNLRTDSLAQMLTCGNVHSGNRMLVFDQCVGMLVGACMERMGGCGKVVHVYAGGFDPVRTAYDNYNFPADYQDSLHHFHIKFLANVKRNENPKEFLNKDISQDSEGNCDINTEKDQDLDELNTEDIDSENVNSENVNSENVNSENKSKSDNVEVKDEKEESNETKGIEDHASCDNPTEPPPKKLKTEESSIVSKEESSSVETVATNKKEHDPKKHQWWLRRQHKTDTLQKTFDVMREQKFDGLLVAGRVHPTPVVMELMEFVAPSRPVVVFSSYKEPLLDCYMKLKNSGSVINIRISETWWRNYQVLPDRTHPEINMQSHSGFMLSAIKVQPH